MQDLVELGLRRPDAPWTDGDQTATRGLLERLLVSLADHAPDADPAQKAAFQTKLDEYRRGLKAAETPEGLAEVARQCADLCETYLRGSVKYVVARETELRELITILREAAGTLAGESAAFSAQVHSSTERFSALVKLDDIRELKVQLTNEVSTLRRVVEDRRKKEEQSTAKLSKRVETLQTQLVVAEEQASMDGLTRVANRAAFDKTLLQMIGAARSGKSPLSLGMLDLDNFKQINDTHGHQVGDRVLLCAAMWLTKGLRQTDFVARYGGEEFAVILHGARLPEVEKRLTAVLADIASKSFEYESADGPKTVRFTASCGATEFGGSDTPEDLIRRADEALYEAKRKGKNRVVGKKKSLIGGLLGRG